MPNKRNPNITPLPVAIADAKKLIAANKLPTQKELALRWHCSVQRVPLVLKSARASNPLPTKAVPIKTIALAKPPIHRGRPARASVAPTNKLLSRISDAVSRMDSEFQSVQKNILSLPGLTPADTKKLVKLSQAAVWSNFHQTLSNELAAIEKLSSGRKRRRGRRKNAVKKVVE